MISRRRILSRSQEVLNDCNSADSYEAENDIWLSKDKLFKDHIQEILEKWDQIDDEIWGKIVCFERNRRVAKAYARSPILTINGSTIGFDGFRIGLNGFNNPFRDEELEMAKRQIGSGAKIKIDNEGNILIKRIGKPSVFVKVWQSSVGQKDGNNNHCVSDDILGANGQLEFEKSVKLFDMDKFLANVTRELKNSYPNRRTLESQCVSCVSFVYDGHCLLDLPVWIMIVNIVALDMLKMKLPTAWIKNASVPNLLADPFDECPTAYQSHHYYSGQSPDGHHRHVDHTKCSANRLTVRRWSALYPNASRPLLPPRDHTRDDKIRKLKEELQAVRIKLGNIEDMYGFNGDDKEEQSKDKTKANLCHSRKTIADDIAANSKAQRNYSAANNNNNNNSNCGAKSVYSQYDSGLDSDPYTDNGTIYGVHQQQPIMTKFLQANDIYDTIWE